MKQLVKYVLQLLPVNMFTVLKVEDNNTNYNEPEDTFYHDTAKTAKLLFIFLFFLFHLINNQWTCKRK